MVLCCHPTVVQRKCIKAMKVCVCVCKGYPHGDRTTEGKRDIWMTQWPGMDEKQAQTHTHTKKNNL